MGEGLWIALAVVAVLLLAALVVGLMLYRRRRVTLSRSDTATPIDRSGGYTASSAIAFTESSATDLKERIDTTGLPAVGDDATIPRDSVKPPIADVHLPELDVEAIAPLELDIEAPPESAEAPAEFDVGAIAPPEGRLERLRGRLSKSQNAIGRSLLGLLGGGDLDEDSWQDVEDTLLVADLGPTATESVVSALRSRRRAPWR